MRRSGPEVADIFCRYGAAWREQHWRSLSTERRAAMTAIERCRTAALGGHVEQCDHCAERRISYNSCRSRNCPKCQSLARAEWIEARQAELLDTQYFHVVFTIPDQIAAIAFQNAGTVYDIMFRTAAETLRSIAADPKHLGAEIGFFSVLHTWGQNLLHHPHLHCVVPGGGLSPDGRRWNRVPAWLLSSRGRAVPAVLTAISQRLAKVVRYRRATILLVVGTVA
ncbi:hypothetical protein ABIA06_003455 [Bradyrhizobium yuanmingense]